ncbi:MAG: GGDEF domain-containing protein [Actinomycetota bacterium]|nr:GGDEF domain-containing protein [Actinomycetota bacterium]
MTLVEFSAELPSELLVSIRDVHERRLKEDELEEQATTDPLTGLANRAGLRRLLDEREQAGTGFALALCDLDGFKAVNDTLGHQAGDEVLVIVARRLEAALGPDAGLARLGGDEFVVVLDAVDKQGAQEAADEMVRALAEPMRTAAGMCEVTGSVGITLSSRPHSVRVLLAEADAAMYRAKHAGKSCWELTEL